MRRTKVRRGSQGRAQTCPSATHVGPDRRDPWCSTNVCTALGGLWGDTSALAYIELFCSHYFVLTATPGHSLDEGLVTQVTLGSPAFPSPWAFPSWLTDSSPERQGQGEWL